MRAEDMILVVSDSLAADDVPLILVWILWLRKRGYGATGLKFDSRKDLVTVTS